MAACIDATERVFQSMLNAYERGLIWVLRHQFFVLSVAAVTLVATVWLYVIVPKGLLPQQDTGMILGITDAAQSISFRSMVQRQREISERVSKDPDVAYVASFVGGGTVNATMNTGRLYIGLKPPGSIGRPAPLKSLIACVRQPGTSRVSPCLCRPSRTCKLIAGSVARNTSIPFRMPMRPNYHFGLASS